MMFIQCYVYLRQVYALLLFCDWNVSLFCWKSKYKRGHKFVLYKTWSVLSLDVLYEWFVFFQGCGKNMPSDQLHHQCFSRGIHPYCVSRPYSNPVQAKSRQFTIVNIHTRTSLWAYLFAQFKTQYCIKQSVVRMAIKTWVKL